MYKRKPQKSFFDDTGTTSKPFFHKNKHHNKENRPLDIDGPAVVPSKASLLKLAAFHCDTKQKTPTKEFPSQHTDIELRSSQNEPRIHWKVSPPPQSAFPSTQKLTINEMFDIFQGSQKLSQTPTRRAKDLSKNQPPLPYLDLEVSPAQDKVVENKADLRRTTSLPIWSAGEQSKKRKLCHGGDKVRSMIEQVQRALGGTIEESEEVTISRKDTEEDITKVASDDFGDDIDDALLALPETIAEVTKEEVASSDYDLDLDEQDFLAASQMHILPEALPELEEEFSDYEQDNNPNCTTTDTNMYTISKAERIEEAGKPPKLLLQAKSDRSIIISLEGDWAHLDVKEGDALRCHGVWHSKSEFRATNTHGLVIIHPDVLVSATSVADAHNCMRKSVLQDRVKATSFLSKALIYGSIMHAILQTALSLKDFSDKTLRKEIDVQIATNLEKLYLIDLQVQEAKDYLFEKLGLLQRWAYRHFQTASAVEPMRGNGALIPVEVGVQSSLEIEERFWSPMYGLKGNVDVTAQLNVVVNGQSSIKAAPFEFKTGKTDYQQSSYRAQVMLYTLMMSERYKIDVTAGFLYYLESGQITRVAVLHNEIRGLIMLRNEVATHIKAKTLPPLKKNKFMCRSCYAAESCFTYHKTFDGGDGESSGIGEVFEEKINHLGERDVAFFHKWESLITQEEGEMFRFRNELWHMTSDAREAAHRCFANVRIVPGSEKHDTQLNKMTQWTYEMTRDEPFSESQITEREPIVISDEEGRYAIACGFVAKLQPRLITICVDRPLRDSRSRLSDFDLQTNQCFTGISNDKVNNIRYRIDRDEFKNGMGTVRNNLIALLLSPDSKNASTSIGRLRNLIVDLEPPKFSNIPLASSRPTQLKLNADQIKAKDKVMSAKDYALILGMPGTGKTTTIANIIKSLVDAGQSVLLTSYTHSAVDTIILKLAKHNMKILRLGGIAKINPEVLKFVQTEAHSCQSFDELDKHYNLPNVVATTCLSINHAILQKRQFDYCIFDEASQATLPVCIGPLRFADKFVLVGDHYQLPPLVKDADARAGGLDISLFKLLCEAHPSAVVYLQHQYRMNSEIMSISNKLIYGGRLACGTESVASQILRADLSKLHALHTSTPCRPCWLQTALDPARKVVYLNTDRVEGSGERKCKDQIVNDIEAKLVAQLVLGLSLCGVRDVDIGIISPYRRQLKAIDAVVRNPNIVVDTADKYQGRDKDCIIISLVRSNDTGNVGDLLSDWRRINVAMTRAKSKMIVIGSQNTLANDALLNAFLHYVHAQKWAVDLPSDALSRHPTPELKTSSTSPSRALRETKHIKAGAKAIINKQRPILKDIMNSL